MRAASLGETAHQAVVGGIEEENAHVGAFMPLLGHDLGQVSEAFARARVRADRHQRLGTRPRIVGERRDELGGEVVHAKEARVLERLQRHALPGSRHARKEDQLHYSNSSRLPPAASLRITASWRAMNSRVESMPRVIRMWLRTAASTSTARLRP